MHSYSSPHPMLCTRNMLPTVAGRQNKDVTAEVLREKDELNLLSLFNKNVHAIPHSYTSAQQLYDIRSARLKKTRVYLHHHTHPDLTIEKTNIKKR